MSENTSKKCFFICPIGEDNSPTRERSDVVRDLIVGPIMEHLGLKLIRADEINKTGQITRQIVDEIVNADLIVADLTDHNPNVFYELAFAHGMRKPTVMMIEQTGRIPFDLGADRVIHYALDDVKRYEKAKKELREIADAELNNDAPENPLSLYFQVQQLQGSSELTDQVLGQLLEITSQTWVTMERIGQQVDWLTNTAESRRKPLTPEEAHQERARARQNAVLSELMRIDAMRAQARDQLDMIALIPKESMNEDRVKNRDDMREHLERLNQRKRAVQQEFGALAGSATPIDDLVQQLAAATERRGDEVYDELNDYLRRSLDHYTSARRHRPDSAPGANKDD